MGLARSIVVEFQPGRVPPGELCEIAIRHKVLGRMFCLRVDPAGVGLFLLASGLTRGRSSESHERNRAHKETESDSGYKPWSIPKPLYRTLTTESKRYKNEAREKERKSEEFCRGGLMAAIGRRRLLETAGMVLAAGKFPVGRVSPLEAEAQKAGKPLPLQLKDFEPRSMLHVPETKVPKSRYPVIDIHTHLSSMAKHAGGVGIGEEMEYFAPVEDLLPLMDRKNVRIMVNLTGGVGNGLEEAIRKYQTPHPDRFLTFTEPWWERSNQPGYSQFQADEIARAHKAGARGLKILKTLGLYLREKISTGPLVKVDDKRFDPMWEACGSLGIPVAIHVSDPEAFFLPID